MWPKIDSDNKFRFPADLISGFTSSVSTIPDALAAAVIAGVNPINGIYSGFIAPLFAAWTTSSVFMRVATTGALALAADSVAHNVNEKEKLTYIVLITLIAGIFQLMAGIFKLGWIINFISNSVMRGFLTAISILIILGQMPEVSGNDTSKASNKLVKTIDILSSPAQFNWHAIATTAFTILCIILLKKTKAKHLAFMLALVIGTILIHTIPGIDVKLVGDENKITSGFPPFSIPEFKHILKVSLAAFAIALIGFLEGSGVSHLKPNPDGHYPDNSTDLKGQGLANIACSFFSGIPVGGSMSQTSILIDSGAKSRWANFLSGALLLIMLLLMGSLIETLPYTCFAAILIVAALESIKTAEIKTIWETSIHSIITMLAAFALTIALPLHFAVVACLILTAILHLIHKPNHIVIKSLIRENGNFQEVSAPESLKSNDTQVLIPYGVLIFSGAYEFQNKMPEIKNSTNTTVIVSLRGKKEIGSSFLSVILDYAKDLKKNKNKLQLIGVSDIVFQQLQSTNILEEIGEPNIHRIPVNIKGSAKQFYKKEEEKMVRNNS